MIEATYEETKKYLEYIQLHHEFDGIRKLAAVFYPTAISFTAEFISEYNDEGGYDMYLSTARFYNENNEPLNDYIDDLNLTEEEWPDVLKRMNGLGFNTKDSTGYEYTLDTMPSWYLEDLIKDYLVVEEDGREIIELDFNKPPPQTCKTLYTHWY